MPLYARRMADIYCNNRMDTDEALIAFWDRFPCPPPWNKGLLFKMNWTGCCGASIGQAVLMRMAQKCSIPIPENYQALKVEPNPCGLRCQLLIVIICCVFLLTMMIVLLVICYRKKSKKLDSPSHQIALGPYRYYDKGYSGTAHTANPMLRHTEALLVGDKLETRIFNGNLDAMYKHYVTDSLHKPIYDEPNCHELSLPLNNSYKPAIESDVTPSTASSGDKSPIYETIDGEDDELLHELYDYTYPREITVRFSDSYSPGKSPPYDSVGRHTKRNNSLKLDIPNRSNRPHKDSESSASSQRRRKKPKYCRTDSSSYSDQTEMSSLSTSDGSSGRYSAPLTNGSFYSSHIVYR